MRVHKIQFCSTVSKPFQELDSPICRMASVLHPQLVWLQTILQHWEEWVYIAPLALVRSFCKLLNVLSWRISVTYACSLSAGRQTWTGSSRRAFSRKCTKSTLCTTCSRPLSNFTQGSYYTETSRYYNSCDSLQCLTEEEFSWSCEYGQVRSAFWLFLLLCLSIH